MIFDYSEFIEELRNKEDKKLIISKYEKTVEPFQTDLKQQRWYKDYLRKFSPFEYATPKELVNDYDWHLLLKLVIGSFSSDYELKKNKNGDYDLCVAIRSGNSTFKKTISELWSFQILRCYEIYIEEQMSLQITMNESLLSEREKRLRQWEEVLQGIARESILEENEASIFDLYSDILN